MAKGLHINFFYLIATNLLFTKKLRMQNKREELRLVDGIKVRVISGFRPAEILAKVRPDETLVAYITEKFRNKTFAVMLSHHNCDVALPSRKLFIHNHKKAYHNFTVLVPVTEAQHMRELEDYDYANEWKKQIPKEYY